jgi:hypothetical protein
VANAGGITNIAAEREAGGYDEDAALARIRTARQLAQDAVSRSGVAR